MNIIKNISIFLFIFIVTFSFTFILPYYMHKKINKENYYTIEGGPMEYHKLIVNSESATSEIQKNANLLVIEQERILRGQNTEFRSIITLTGCMIGGLIICIGIILLKLAKQNNIAISLIVSGIIVIIGYLYFIYTCIINQALI